MMDQLAKELTLDMIDGDGLYTTTGDCIGYATSATKLQTLTNVTIA